MTASASYLSPAARLTSTTTRSASQPATPTSKSLHGRPPAHPTPLLTVLSANFLALLNVCGQMLFALSTTCLAFLHTYFTPLLSRLTSYSVGYTLWTALLAALPVPLTSGVEYAVPFPFAGATNVEEAELSGVSYAMTLYTPVALRRRRKHTVSKHHSDTLSHTCMR